MVCGKTEEEIFKKAAEHAQTVHNMRDIPRELMERARGAIHNVT